MERKADIPEFTFVGTHHKRICWPPWFDPIPPWDWLDKVKQVALFTLRIKYYQQMQDIQLKYQKELVEIQRNYMKEISGMLG